MIDYQNTNRMISISEIKLFLKNNIYESEKLIFGTFIINEEEMKKLHCVHNFNLTLILNKKDVNTNDVDVFFELRKQLNQSNKEYQNIESILDMNKCICESKLNDKKFFYTENRINKKIEFDVLAYRINDNEFIFFGVLDTKSINLFINDTDKYNDKVISNLKNGGNNFFNINEPNKNDLIFLKNFYDL